MLHVLVVDDEKLMAESVKAEVNWPALGVDSVHLAFNIRQAKDVFLNHTIDIMLCDIEMPQGSGLELLVWVKEHYAQTACIFLTCHADFKYAQQAMQLGSLDYLLKPVMPDELEKALAKAAETIRKESKLMQFSQLGQFWHKHQPLLVERFWLDLIHHSIPPNAEAVRLAAVERNIPLSPQLRLLPVLIDIQRFHKPLNQREGKILEFALRNAAEEALLANGNGQMVTLGVRRLLAIVACGPEQGGEAAALKAVCESYIASCRPYFYCDIACYIGETVPSHQLAASVQQLLFLAKNNVSFSNKVFLYSEPRPSARITLPDMDVWSVMLKDGSADTVLAEAELFLHQLMGKEGFDAATLQQFHHDFMQMVYYVLKLKGIHAHRLFGDPESAELSSQAANTIVDMIAWLRHLVGKAMQYVVRVEMSQSIVDKVMGYVSQHLDAEELSREELANHVYLNPDYLDRLFKKETGSSVTEYIVQERMKLARHLLAKTDMPVSVIAGQAGYSNLSHFSRRFKQIVGFTPNDYRQSHRET